MIEKTAPLSDRLPPNNSYLTPASTPLLFSGGRYDAPVVEVSCSSDGLNEVLYDT
jgi:hypothetical protein